MVSRAQEASTLYLQGVYSNLLTYDWLHDSHFVLGSMAAIALLPFHKIPEVSIVLETLAGVSVDFPTCFLTWEQ